MLIFLQWLHKKDREKDLSMIVKKERESDFSIFLQWLYRMEKERLNCWFFFNNYIKRRKRVILIVLVYQWLYNYTRWPPPKKRWLASRSSDNVLKLLEEVPKYMVSDFRKGRFCNILSVNDSLFRKTVSTFWKQIIIEI